MELVEGVGGKPYIYSALFSLRCVAQEEEKEEEEEEGDASS